MNIEEMRERIMLCDEKKPYLFISYSKMDADKVYPVVLDLQNMGINIWIDKNLEDQAGKSWQIKAFDAIRNGNCEKVVFFMSKNSFFSIPVCAELKFTQHKKVALNHGGKKVEVIPVSIDEDGNIGKVKNKCLNDEHSRDLIGEDAYNHIFRNCLNEEELGDCDEKSNYGALITLVYNSVFDGNSEINVVSDVVSIIKNIPREMIKNNNIEIFNVGNDKLATTHSVDSKIDEIVSKNGRDMTKYKFNGQEYSKGRLVLQIIKEATKIYHTYDELDEALGGFLTKHKNVLIDNYIQSESDKQGGKKRYFTNSEDLIKIDGKDYFFTNQWGAGEQFNELLRFAKDKLCLDIQSFS